MRWNGRSLLALAPTAQDASAFVVAAGRAGGLGILDGTSPSGPAEALRRLGRFADPGSFAIRVHPDQVDEVWLSSVPAGLAAVVCAGPWTEGELESARKRISTAGLALLCEVISTSEADSALRCEVDGLIAVGHEAAGRVGKDSAFVLLQAIVARTVRPVWVRGGIGARGAAACVAAGATGVVLEGALLCTRESPLPKEIRDRLATWDGSETTLIDRPDGSSIRVYAPPGSTIVSRLREASKAGEDAWRLAAATLIGWGPGQAWPIGQDAAFAAGLAKTHVTIGGIVQAVDRAVRDGIGGARKSRPLAADSPLAKSHRCRLPILQGPMTRVSDVAPFAASVAAEGGLPFLALALLKGSDVRRLLEDTARLVGGRSWGVGILGFAPPELRKEQLTEVKAVRPPFALIAGGRPDQAAELEQVGITTYLHVPSPGLLEQFLKAGVRRFVLEGRECGGHVGPRSSFLLWEQACSVLEKAIAGGIEADSLHIVFAGGIHDARSAAAAAALAGDLVAKGLRIGVLMGTAYLFTQEAVASGAILQRFQDEAVRCQDTVLLETGPGHLVRVSPTPFVARFEAERQRLIAEGRSHEEIREALERLNAGRLRVAAKGVDRALGADSRLVALDDAAQSENGLYMLGQVAALRDEVVSMAELHHEVTTAATAWLQRTGPESRPEQAVPPKPEAIAIVGMSAILPGAGDVETFWANSLRGIDSIQEIPPDRWDWKLYYDPDQKAPDKIYSKWGGFVPDIPFDPIRYGMPPSSLPSIEPAQLLALEVTRAALADAGYADRPFNRERTAVVLGMGGGAAQVAMGYAFRSYLPMLDTVSKDAGKAAMGRCEGLLPEWTEDSFPGFLLNVTAGRIANRFDFGGANYTVDAACGSSLAALNLAARELRSGAADMVVLGGVDTVQNPFTYLAFSKTQAFSPNGRCRPFDAGADGIVISEGVAAVVLKRLADAERDGDRIYAVIHGIGSSSDGRSRGLTAPGIEGQMRALGRAYGEARIDPASVGYVEAHGTGTAVGDVVELDALSRLFRESGAKAAACVVGSVKSQIGHTKCAAGLAGLIHASLALHHKVLPPTIGIRKPNPRLDLKEGPFRLNSESQPWLHHDRSRPRRAGVSAFGFGGTNFHAVLEAYEANTADDSKPALRDWPAELLLWKASDRAALLRTIDSLAAQLTAGARPALRELAQATVLAARSQSGATLAIVASSIDDLIAKLATARNAVQGRAADLVDPSGVYFTEKPQFVGSQVAFLFPGQGSQSVGMLKDLAIAFDEVRVAAEESDEILVGLGREPVGPRMLPPPAFDEATRNRQIEELRATDVAQPAIGAASVAMLRLMSSLGLQPNIVGGHSYGELVALHAAGAVDLPGLVALSEGRGRLMREAGGKNPGSMAALQAGPEAVADLIRGQAGVMAVNFNGPHQTVVAGMNDAVAKVLERAEARKIPGKRLPVAGAFHTPILSSASASLAALAARAITKAPAIPVFSNLDALPHSADVGQIAARIGQHLTNPVRFTDMIFAMYESGSARVFVEVGPGGSLTPMVDDTLEGLPHLAVACENRARPGIVGLLHALARLTVAGIDLSLDALTVSRATRRLNLDALPIGDGSDPLPPSTWMVNGSRSRPLSAPEPKRLGQAVDPSSVPSPEITSQHQDARVTRPMNDSSPVDSPSNGHANHSAPSVNGMTNGEHYPSHPVPRAVPHSGSVVPGSASASDRVLIAFQETMKSFLEVQRDTMLAYLGQSPRRPAVASVPGHITERPAAPAAPSYAASRPAPARTSFPTSKRSANGPAQASSSPPPKAASSQPSTRTASPSPSAPKVIEVAVPQAQVVIDRTVIANRLLEIVRDRTGYPAEVLRLELDVEADLGIDSIKRVEILGKLRDAFPQLGAMGDSDSMDRLARASTLGAIVDRVEKMIAAKPEAASAPKNGEANGTHGHRSASRSPETKDGGETRRLTLRVVDAPLSDVASGLAPHGIVLIADDDRGVALDVADRLEARGIRAVRIGGPGFEVDWSSPKAVASVVAEARQLGPIAGLIHLSPLGEAARIALDPAAWEARISAEARSLFLLAREIADDLGEAAERGGACLIATTSLGGTFASGSDRPDEFFAGQGAVAGLVKTLAREWEAVRCRVIDFNRTDANEVLAGRIVSETLTDDDWSEVGYAKGRRVRLQPVVSPLRGAPGTSVSIARGEPVLITGGARGITALVATELSRRWQPTLLLIGTTPPPPVDGDPELDPLTNPSEIKGALYERHRKAGKSPSPGDLEREFQAVMRGREVRKNLDSMRAAGSHVEYAQVDVRDESAMARTLADWRGRFGDPVGVIHGAGLIKDKLIRDKSPESFDRVLGTKLDGSLNLIRLLNPEQLKFTVFFSSIAGRFGNKGQSDYAAANEILSKLAIWLDERWKGRVVSMIWGPWSGVGMVSDLEGHLGSQGLGMIAPEVGVSSLLHELTTGRKGDVEVIVSGDLGTLDGPVGSKQALAESNR